MNDDPTRRDDGAPLPNATHTPSTRRSPAPSQNAHVDPSASAVSGPREETLPYGRIPDHEVVPDPDVGVDLAKPSFKVAPITISLIIAMGAIELLFTFTDGAAGALRETREQVFNLFAFSPLETYLWWQGRFPIEALYGVFGHMMLHGGLLHFGLNAAAMAFLGPTVERDGGPRNYVFIFIVAGVGGALGHGLWQYGVGVLNPEFGPWPLRVELVGASGAISGLLGAELYRRAGVLRAAPPGPGRRSPLKYLANASIGFLVVNVLISLVGSYISGASHIGGFLAGMAAAAIIGLGSRPPVERPTIH